MWWSADTDFNWIRSWCRKCLECSSTAETQQNLGSSFSKRVDKFHIKIANNNYTAVSSALVNVFQCRQCQVHGFLNARIAKQSCWEINQRNELDFATKRRQSRKKQKQPWRRKSLAWISTNNNNGYYNSLTTSDSPLHPCLKSSFLRLLPARFAWIIMLRA